jgi:hypothetical protein
LGGQQTVVPRAFDLLQDQPERFRHARLDDLRQFLAVDLHGAVFAERTYRKVFLRTDLAAHRVTLLFLHVFGLRERQP